MPTGWDRQVTQKEKPNQNLDTISTQTTQTSESFSSAETEINRMEMFVPEEPNRCFDDLILPLSVKERLEAALRESHKINDPIV